MKIVFMGTPGFAVPCLEKIVKAGYEVVGVITAPDKPAGRGMNLMHSSVKSCALNLQTSNPNLKILQPTNLKNQDFLQELKDLNADLFVVVAFRMLPESVWAMPPKGTINLHASLLPNYRGAAPINWAIINGETETGVTTFFIEKEIDTGKIIDQMKFPIPENWNVGDLHDFMAENGSDLLVQTLNHIQNGTTNPKDQDISLALKSAPKLNNENCIIDWNKTAVQIHNQIRGLSPFPGAFTHFQGKIMKIYESKVLTDIELSPGQVHLLSKKRMVIGTKEGVLEVLNLKMEGKKQMNIVDFLAGNKFEEFNLLA